MKGKQTINIEQWLIHIKEELKTSEISKENKVETWLGFLGSGKRAHAKACVHELAVCMRIL